MLKLVIAEAAKLNLDKILVTCDKENIASSKTIKACGGVLENEVPEEDGITQRYWIQV